MTFPFGPRTLLVATAVHALLTKTNQGSHQTPVDVAKLAVAVADACLDEMTKGPVPPQAFKDI